MRHNQANDGQHFSRWKRAAVSQCACTPYDCGVLLTGFVCAYPTNNTSWIFRVLQRGGLLAFFTSTLPKDAIRAKMITDVTLC